MSSNGIFPRTYLHWRSSRRSRKTCKIDTLNLKLLKIESSSCQCSNDIEWTKRGISEKFISNSGKVKRHAKRFSRKHWIFLSPGTLSYTPEGKWDSTATQMVERFNQEHHCFDSWNSEKKQKKRYHTLPCGCVRTQNSYFARFTQQISSVSTEQSQAGVKSSVWSRVREMTPKRCTKENEQLLKNVNRKK